VQKERGEGKMNRKLALFSIALLAMLMISAFPAKAWVYPDNSTDKKIEVFGPHVKGILVKLYANEEDEWTAMDNNQIDFEDWPLTNTWINAWQADPRFNIQGYGGEAGYFIIDTNNNPNLLLDDGTPNPAVDSSLGINPFSIVSLKQAIACLVNRSYIVNTICEGLALPMWTAVPRYMTTYVHPDIMPGGTLDALTYGGYEGDVTLALTYLNDDGFLYIPAEYPWRFYDQNGNGHYDVGEDFRLIFYSRSDSGQRFNFANNFDLILTSDPIKLDIDYRPSIRAVCSDHVFGAKEFHMYTGGWISIGPDPDFLYDLYHSSAYSHPGKPSNYDFTDDALLDTYAADIKFATTIPASITAAMDFQVRFAQIVESIPLWCASGYKAYRKTSVEEGGAAQWLGVVNQDGFGVNSWWTFLDLMKECEYYPNTYVDYGFMSPTIEWRNPIYAQWYWDWEFIGKIYDGCAARNPYSLGEFLPQLAKTWEVGTWIDPNTHEEKSKVRVTLRSDLKWSDGVPITTADMSYTFIDSVNTLIAKGLPTPWYYPTVQYFRSFYIIDPLNIEILLDVKSVFAVGWVIGTVVIPKHIWKPLVDASTQANNIVYGAQPDPLVIGSGPFKYVSYTPNVNAVLDANPDYWQFCPIHVNVNTLDYRVKKDPTFPNTVMDVSFDVSVTNLFQGGKLGSILDGSKFVYVDGVLIAGPVPEVIPNGTTVTEHFTVPLTKCKHLITAAFHIESPPFLDDPPVHANPWICQWINVTIPVWVTIKQDVGGALYESAVPAPDCKVDGKDVAFASSAFNTVPGNARWNSVADVTVDYKVDGKDIANIAKYFGKW
jgi:ABC-type transport system substrate-binding protein